MNNKIELGLRQNWKQFSLLVVINAFVGGMVGLERSIFPEFAESQFGITSHSAVLSFIVAFGLTKALTNYFTGRFANRFGRKNLLLLGWLIGIPVPIILMYASNWNLVVLANILLGVNQGLTWSSTVVMKIDLVGQKERGLAMGFNEFAGYFAVGLVALISGYIAHEYGITPYPFYLGLIIAIVGLLLSFFVIDTRRHVQIEQKSDLSNVQGNVFLETSFLDRNLSAISQAGMVNNLNDGMIWGLLPALLISLSYSLDNVGILAAIYPTVWGLAQLFTGRLADIYKKKGLLVLGMAAQGAGILALAYFQSYMSIVVISILLGLGTALVYPTFLAAISDFAHPDQRAESIGVFRLWRDMGYAFGAIFSGIIADLFGIQYAIITIGILTVLSSLVVKFRMD